MLPALAAHGQPPRSSDESLRDAQLNDVSFVDPDRGWAVGDRGVIWHTEDGGRHWRLQPSAVTCRLNAVQFVDDRNGWIVGGWTHPYTHFNSGVVLRTADGGQHWEPIPRLSLPALKGVRFLDQRTGWAVGEISAMYSAGVFRTADGGRSWSSIPGGEGSGWLTGDLWSGQAGAVAGRDGRVAWFRETGIEPAESINVGGRRIQGLRFSPMANPAPDEPQPRPSSPPLGCLVGDGGLVLLSVDGGRSWREPPGPLPEGMYDFFDYQAVAVHGNRCWIVGSPGSRVLHTADGGRSWRVLDTGHRLPLRGVTFLDENRGWAVGSLGTILATRDGGRTWSPQLRGGTRAALWACFGRPEQVPLELLSTVAANDGYLSVVQVLHAPSPESSDAEQTNGDERMHEAVLAVGGTQAELAWGFPARRTDQETSAQEVVAAWDQLHQGRGQERLEELLVRRIRQWRPELLVIPAGDVHGGHALQNLDHQLLLSAVSKAADPGAFSAHAALVGLEPWTVNKVFSSLGAEAPGTLNLTLSQLASRLGCPLSEHAKLGWPMLREHPEPVPQTLGFSLLVNRLPQDLGRKDFFSGLSLPAGGDARRELASSSSADARTLSRTVQQRRNVSVLLKHLTTAAQNGAPWLGQVEDLTRGLDEAGCGEVLYEMAESLRRTGQLPLAAEAFDLLVKKFPRHPLCEPSLLWLVQYYASGEAASWRTRPAGRAAPGVPPAAAIIGPLAAVGPAESAAASGATGAAGPASANRGSDPAAITPPSPIQQVSFDTPVPRTTPTRPSAAATSAASPQGLSSKDRARRALAYAEALKNLSPAVSVEPQIRFPIAAAQRALGQPAEAERIYHAIVSGRTRDAWWACARSELWLVRPNRAAPRPLAKCLTTAERPKLDGQLGDSAWKNCLPAALTSPERNDAEWPAAAMFACDQEFLYLAANCRRAPKVAYTKSDSPRPRDPDLTAQDRVEFFLDVDRDYATCFRLTVDHRGWVQEACLGATAWNPTWYVAAHDDGQSWTVEAALPWTELGLAGLDKQQVWAVGIQRTVPGVGTQTWTGPPTASPKSDSFGWLMFE